MSFCFSIHLGNMERASRAQKLARLWDCSTQMPWPHPGSLGERWLELQVCSMLVVGKMLHLRTARLRDRRQKTGILSRQQNAWICAKHILEVVGSDLRLSFEETTAGQALDTLSDSSSLLSCIFLHPYIEPGPSSFAEKEKMELHTRSCRKNLLSFSHPAEIQGAGCSYGKSSVLPKKTKAPAPWIWHLTTPEWNVDPREMDWLCALVRHWNCS